MIHPHRVSADQLSSPGVWRRPRLGQLWFRIFILAIALLGGSSRYDLVQNGLLLPIIALLLIPSLYHLQWSDIERARILFGFLGVILLWMAVQITPLPPGVWQALPKRDLIADLDRLVGLEGVWRPISASPFRSLHSLLGLMVPVAAAAIVLSMRITTRALLLCIVLLGCVNASIGLLQIVSGSDSPLYMYAISNRNAPSGLFANENHSAVFSAICLVVTVRLAIESRRRGELGRLSLFLGSSAFLVILAVLAGGSRAGFAATLFALSVCMLMALFAFTAGKIEEGQGCKWRAASSANGLGILICFVALVLLVTGFIALERVPALRDLLAEDPFEELRWSLLPILTDMIETYWLFGTGFGSFDVVYRLHEPTALLVPTYMNQAHNDWAQLLIEGGLPALICLIAFIGWIFLSIYRIGTVKVLGVSVVIFWLSLCFIVMGFSLVDYPLRTPIYQAVSIWLILILQRDHEVALPVR